MQRRSFCFQPASRRHSFQSVAFCFFLMNRRELKIFNRGLAIGLFDWKHSKAQIARRLRLSRSTIYRWIRQSNLVTSYLSCSLLKCQNEISGPWHAPLKDAEFGTMFSDESSFRRFPSDGRVMVWCVGTVGDGGVESNTTSFHWPSRGEHDSSCWCCHRSAWSKHSLLRHFLHICYLGIKRSFKIAAIFIVL